jgi:hypothetical protein
VSPSRQQNPPGPLKLLGLRKKTGKNTDFDFAQITLNILVAHLPQCAPRNLHWVLFFLRTPFIGLVGGTPEPLTPVEDRVLQEP